MKELRSTSHAMCSSMATGYSSSEFAGTRMAADFAGATSSAPLHVANSEAQVVNILIVDDEPMNLVVLETILDDPGYQLVRAGSADQALLALLKDEFAVLILDIRMPGTTGIELAAIIKERKKTSRIPIIFLTAYYNEDQHILEGYEAGAVDFMHKPVNAAVLRSKVAVFAQLHLKQREILAANRALQVEIRTRQQAEERLRELNESLEARVAERTRSIQFLMKEVNHRSKNLLSVAQAIAKQTVAGGAHAFFSSGFPTGCRRSRSITTCSSRAPGRASRSRIS